MARSDQRLPFSHGDLFAPPAPDMQLLEPIQPLDPLVVDELAGLPQLEVNHANPVTPVTLREGDDPSSQRMGAIGTRLVTQRASTHAHDLQSASVPEPLRLHPPHQLTTRRRGPHFVLSASRVTSFSSIDSASSFF